MSITIAKGHNAKEQRHNLPQYKAERTSNAITKQQTSFIHSFIIFISSLATQTISHHDSMATHNIYPPNNKRHTTKTQIQIQLIAKMIGIHLYSR